MEPRFQLTLDWIFLNCQLQFLTIKVTVIEKTITITLLLISD